MINVPEQLAEPSRQAVQDATDNPHELLGLAPGESDPMAIVAAAQFRLVLLRINRGSETAVIRELVRQVKAARDAMLDQARRAAW